MITLVAGARPNFVKLAPIIREFQRRDIPFRWIHTGQHSGAMSDPIIRELEMPQWNARLLAQGSHAEMTAAVMVGVERDLIAHRPDWLVVVGDVNSTLGAALAAVKLGVKIAHVEAGYRSYDWAMPEEVNRVLVDRMSNLLLYPDEFVARVHRLAEPHATDRRLVGNVMMDSLRWALERAPGPTSAPQYAVLTVHRPSNVDSSEAMLRVLRFAEEAAIGAGLPIIWPAHPRVRASCGSTSCRRIDVLGYLDMVALLRDASLVITDSGGVYEEALYLGKKIVSLRGVRNERAHLTSVPEIWMTDAAPRIVDALCR